MIVYLDGRVFHHDRSMWRYLPPALPCNASVWMIPNTELLAAYY
jgi:hypothetical protein